MDMYGLHIRGGGFDCGFKTAGTRVNGCSNHEASPMKLLAGVKKAGGLQEKKFDAAATGNWELGTGSWEPSHYLGPPAILSSTSRSLVLHRLYCGNLKLGDFSYGIQGGIGEYVSRRFFPVKSHKGYTRRHFAGDVHRHINAAAFGGKRYHIPAFDAYI